jgi:histidinol-phosphate aminotransferase
VKIKVPVRRTLKRLGAYHAPIEGRAGKLRLDFNENTIGCSPAVRRALSRLSREQVAMYPEYEATKRRFARIFRVRPAELLLTNGMDDGLHLIFDAFVDPGSTVLLVEPTFVMYRFYAAVAGARIIVLRYDTEMRFPVEEVLRALRRRPRVLFIANPNNPTGTLVGKSAIHRILEAAPRTLVVVDEAYFEFSGLTVLPWIRKYPNLVVTRTFSKAAGLAGLRLGCLFAHRDLIAVLHRACSPYPVNSAALAAGDAALRDTPFLRNYVRETRRSREELERALARLGIPVFPSAANFLLADFGARAPKLLAGLERQGILVRDRRSDFGRVGYVRITLGTRAQTRRLIGAIAKLW